jgi:hypothetical protein
MAFNPRTGDLFYQDKPLGATGLIAGWQRSGNNVQYFGLWAGQPLSKFFTFEDGTIMLCGSAAPYVIGAAKNLIPSRSTKVKYYLRNIIGNITLNLLRSHSMNTSASLDYALQLGEMVTVDLDNFSMKSSYLRDISGQFYSGSRITLPEAGTKDLTILAKDSNTKHNDGASQVRGILIDNLSIYNTNNGILYINVVDDGGGSFHYEFFSDAARTVLVGHTASAIPDLDVNQVQDIIPDGIFGLIGYVIGELTVADVDIYYETCLVESYLQYKSYYPSLSTARYQ